MRVSGVNNKAGIAFTKGAKNEILCFSHLCIHGIVSGKLPFLLSTRLSFLLEVVYPTFPFVILTE
jgi:hypothetical protein